MKHFFFRRLLGAICLFVAFTVAPGAWAQNYTPGNLVVLQVGDGSGSLSSAATAVIMKEYSPSSASQTAPVSSIAMPTTVSGGNYRITQSGNAGSEGALILSPDKRYLTLVGYDAAIGTATITGTNSTTTSRVIARVDNAKSINTTTRLNAYSANNIRSAVTSDGNTFWTAGPGTGIVSTTLGSSGVGTVLSSLNSRVINIYNGQLYVSSSSGTNIGINTVGTSLPMSGTQTVTQISGVTATNAYAFVFFDREPTIPGVDLLYIADQTGGILKYSYNGSTWAARGSFTGVATGLTGGVNGNLIELYVTVGTAAQNALYKVTDATSYTSPISGSITGVGTLLATAPANTAFRGVAFAPVAACPTITAALTGTSTICTGSSANLTATITGGTAPYSLTYSDGTSTSVVSGTTIAVSPTVSTTYTIVAAKDVNGCTATVSGSAVVTVSTPAVANAGTSQTISTGGVASLSANTPAVGTGSWSVTSGPSTDVSQFSSTTAPTATFTPAGGAGSYVLTWTISNASCPPSSSSVTITVVTPTVNLSVSGSTASETSPMAITVTATASAPVSGNQTVDIIVSGTGITAGDYTLSNTTITIPNGQTIGSVTFTAVDDAVVEGNETATLVIGNPSANIALGGTTSQDITIIDGNAPTPSLLVSPTSLNFATTAGTVSAEQSYVVSATALTAGVTITASAGVEVSTSSGSGFAGLLTLPQSTTLATIFARLSTGAVAANPFNGSITNVSGSLTATVAISGTVNAANQPPTAPTFADQTGTVAIPFSYTVPAFTDPESQTLSYTITGLPAGLVADNVSLIISGTPTTSSPSTVTVVATDPQSATTAGTFAITINTNAAPVATTLANQTATVGTAFSYTIPAFTDPENQTLTYAATGLPASLIFNATTLVISGTPTVASVSTIVITATDPANNTVSAAFSLSVNATPAGIMRITEFMYNSPVSAGSPATAGEFVELTNVGNAPVNLTGWSLDDSNRTPGFTSLSSLGVVQPGESVIVTEASATDFRTFWYLPTTVKVLGSRSGHGFGNGDEINLYDSSSPPGSSTTTTPVDRLTYPSSGTVITNGVSAWTTRSNLGTNTISGWQLSVLNDAQNSYRSAVNNLGNPGGYYVPLNRVLVRETGGTPGTTAVAEGGATDTYTVALNSQPTANVTITITPGSQLTLSTTTLTFTPANYSTAQTVTVMAIDDAVVNGIRSATITQSAASSDVAYSGITINPVSVTITDNDVAATAPPTIAVANTTTKYLSVSGTGAGFVSGVINDPTDPASTLGIDFTLNDTDTPVTSLTTTLSTNNSAVVPIANLALIGTGASRNLKITPVGVGYATITLAVTDGVTSVSYVVNYAASAASETTASTRFHTGTSDASTAVLVDGNYTLVGDDENQVLRLYNRQNSGLPVAGIDFTTSLGLADISGGVPREVDLEASIRQSNRIFWLGSESNADGGNARPNRDRVFATDLTGSGASTTLSYVGRYDFLKEDIINWDVTNGHGKGANYYGLQASAAASVGSKQPDGYNIEGAEFAPDNSTVYLGLRAPQVLPANRTKALIIPVTNLTTLVSGQVQGSATFGAPIELNLGGRSIREIRKNAASEYLIIAGPAGDATGTAPADFRLFTWTGNAADLPVERNTNLTALNAGGSFESIVELPASLTTGVQVQLLVDNGDAVYYNDGTIAKELAQNNFKKFRSELVTLGAPLNTAPTVANVISPQSASVGTAFSYTIPANTFADAETPNGLTLSIAGLPSSLSLTGSTISGTPSTTVGSPYSVTVTATDPGSLSASMVFSLSVAPAATPVVSATGVVISQVYGGGGNSGAIYKSDFVELFNRTNAPISINGWSVQYASATGTSWQSTTLTGTILAGGYYLVSEATNTTATSASLPTPEAIGIINLSGTAGKVALVSTATPLSGTCPTGGSIVDFVGYGTTASCFEGAGTAGTPTSTTVADLRKLNGCTDTNNNAADFIVAAVNPRNSSSPVNVCGAVVASLVASPTALSGFNAVAGTASNTQTYTLTGSNLGTAPVSVSATANIELSTDNTQFSTTLSLPTTASAISQVVYARITNAVSTTGAFTGTITNTANGTLVASVTVSGQVNPVNAPSLSAAPTSLTGFATTQGTVSAEQAYMLTAANLSSTISVSAPAGVEMSTTSGSGFSSSLTLAAATTPAVVYVRLTGTTLGPVNGTISNTAGNLTANVTISGTVSSTAPYTPIVTARAGVGQTFTVQGRVTVKNQLGSRQIYIQDETGGIAVYSGPTGTDFSTLVQIGDLIQTRGPVTVFNGYLELAGTNNFTVVAGAGTVIPTPLAITPDQLAAHQGELVSVASGAITPVVSMLASGSSYTITAGGQSGIVYINPNSELAGAGLSANPISVTGISDRFVSKSTTTGTDGMQLQPRIITDVSGATAPTDQTCTIASSSTLTRDQTLDVAAWNMEFFGADAGTINCPGSKTLVYNDMGPVNEDLQQSNAVNVLTSLNADIISAEEVSDIDRFAAAVQAIPGSYSYVCSDKFSYFFQDECDQVPAQGTVFGPTKFAQKVCVIYNTATVTPVLAETKPLLFQSSADYTYPGALGGNGSGSGWASGRLPFLFVANVTINGITKKMHIVAVHGKSGSAAADFNRRVSDYNDLKAELDRNYPTANIVMLGDYNDKSTTSIYTGSPISSFNSFVTDAANYNVVTKPLEQNGCATYNPSGGSFIDHITISNDLQPAYVPNSVYVLQPLSIPNYGNTTSDHSPLEARFDLSKLTNPLVASLSGNTTICAGTTAALSVSISGGTSPYSLVYAANGTSTTVSGYSSGAPIQVSPAVSTTYTLVSVTDAANTSGSLSGTAVVTVNPAVAALISGNLTVCTGASTTLTASNTASASGNSFIWSTGEITAAISVSTAGPYSVTVTSNGGCVGSTSVNVIVSPGITAGVVGNLTVCTGTSTTLTATGGNSFIWSTGETTASISATAGAYSVTVASGNCTASASATVTSVANPTATISGNLTVCTGQNTTLTASGGTSYIWSSGQTTASILATAGVYSVTVTQAGCSATASTTVTPVASPTATISGTLTVTSGGSTTLTAGGGSSFIWSTGETAASISVTAGTYSVTVANESGCTSVASATVTSVSPVVSVTGVVISQVYGGGGATSGTPTYQNDYVELFNRTTAPVSLVGLSLQYGSATGQFGSTNNIVSLTGTIGAGQYYLVQLGSVGTAGAALPRPADQVTTNLNLSATNGKVALASTTLSLGCGATATPCSLPNAQIVDLVAYGTSNNAEGGVATPALSTTTAAFRKLNGCTDTDNNGSDFTVATPAPRNSASPANVCGAVVATLVVSPTALSGFTTVAGTISSEQTYTLTSASLSNPVSISAPAGVEVSLTSGSGFASIVSVPASTTTAVIYVRLTGATAGPISGTITNVSGGLTASVSVSGSVTIANTAPTVANAVGPQSATVGVAYMLSLANTFTDAQTPNSLTLTVAGLPASLSLAGTTISGTPSTTVGSPYSVTVTAKDPGGLLVSTVFSLGVAPAPVVNTAPTVANAVGPQSATVGVAYTLSLANTFTDAQTPNSLTISVAGLPTSLSLTGTTLSGTPSTTVGSPYSVTVTATDPSGLSGSTVFALSVAPAPVVNMAPTVANAVGPQSATVGVSYTLLLTNTFTDAETPNSLTLSVAGLPASLSLTGMTISGTPSTTLGSPYSVTVTATDPSGLSGSTVFALSVSPAASMTTSAPFAITGVTTISCTPVANRINLTFDPQYAGLNGSPVSFSVVNEFSSTTDPGPYSLSLYTDNPVITLRAVQAGVVSNYVYNWLAACNGGNPTPGNTPPTVANSIPPQSATVGQGFSYVILANTFTDAQTPNALTLSVNGLPAGLNFTAPATISGTPSMSGTSNVTVTATDPGNLAVSTTFTITVSPSSVTTTPGSPFAITGVTTIDCTPVANRVNLTFNPQYAGLSGNPVSFSVVNELAATTNPGPYSLTLYLDNPVITLRAVQDGVASNFAYNWLAACNSLSMTPGANTPPTVANAVGPQSATVGMGYTLLLANAFTDAQTPNALVLSATGLPGGLSLAGTTISGTPSVSGVSNVTVTATDPGNLSVSTTFTITVSPASMTGTPTGTFAITGVTTVSCTVLSPGQRSVTFTPQYTGLTGSPVSFSVVNELAATTNPGPYTLRLYTDNPVITLQAVQNGVSSSFAYNWLVACNSTSRMSAEPVSPLRLTVLGNPVRETVDVEVSGAAGGSLKLILTDAQGRVVGDQSIEQAAGTERVRFSVGQLPAGVLLLRATTPGQSQSIRVLKVQ